MTRLAFFWNLTALTVLFGGASLTNLGSAYDPLDPALSTARWILIATGLVALSPFLPNAIARHTMTVKGVVIISVWFAFGAVCILSAVMTDDHAEAIASTLWVLLGVPPVFFVGLPRIFQDQAGKLVVLSLLISQAAYIVVSFYLHPSLHFEYKGIFGHPNGLGVTAAVVATCCLACIVERVQLCSIGWIRGLVLITLFWGSCLLVMVSGSRTSLSAVLITAALAVFLCAKYARRRGVLTALAVGLTLSWLAASVLPDLGMARRIWQKHADQVAKGNILSNRDEIWKQVIDEMRLLGNGSEYFPETVGISSHNSIMQIVGQRGPIAGLFMACIAIFSTTWAIARAAREHDGLRFSAAPALIAICFWALSMGEGMFGSFGTGITLAYLLSIGIVISPDTRVPTPTRRLSDPRFATAA